MQHAPRPAPAPADTPAFAARNPVPSPYESAVVPYRAPHEIAPPAPLPTGLCTAFGLVGGGATLGYLGAAVAFVLAFQFPERDIPSPAFMTLFMVSVVVAGLLWTTQLVLGVVWLHRVWSWLPPQQRYARSWSKWITPNEAAWMMLIPYFHYFWMFVVNIGVCDALERMRVTHPTVARPSKNLAIAASVTQLVMPVAGASILWFLYMRSVERVANEMSRVPR